MTLAPFWLLLQAKRLAEVFNPLPSALSPPKRKPRDEPPSPRDVCEEFISRRLPRCIGLEE